MQGDIDSALGSPKNVPHDFAQLRIRTHEIVRQLYLRSGVEEEHREHILFIVLPAGEARDVVEGQEDVVNVDQILGFNRGNISKKNTATSEFMVRRCDPSKKRRSPGMSS